MSQSIGIVVIDTRGRCLIPTSSLPPSELSGDDKRRPYDCEVDIETGVITLTPLVPSDRTLAGQ